MSGDYLSKIERLQSSIEEKITRIDALQSEAEDWEARAEAQARELTKTRLEAHRIDMQLAQARYEVAEIEEYLEQAQVENQRAQRTIEEREKELAANLAFYDDCGSEVYGLIYKLKVFRELFSDDVRALAEGGKMMVEELDSYLAIEAEIETLQKETRLGGGSYRDPRLANAYLKGVNFEKLQWLQRIVWASEQQLREATKELHTLEDEYKYGAYSR